MTAVALLRELRQRGATVAVIGDRLRIEAPAGRLTPELKTELSVRKPELLALLTDRGETTLDDGNPVAVLLTGTVIGAVWLVADADVIAEYPDIRASGLPLFTFNEVAKLTGKDPEELRAIAASKRTFPTGRVLQ